MNNIKASELKVGDIFTFEYKLTNREAFLVEGITETQMLCKSRTTGKSTKKQKKGNVIFLRHEN